MVNQQVQTGAPPVKVDREIVINYLSEILALAVIAAVGCVSFLAWVGGA